MPSLITTRNFLTPYATFVKKIESLAPTTPELPQKTEECDKPIKALKEKLQQKRNKKLATIETHVTRGHKYVSKQKESKQ